MSEFTEGLGGAAEGAASGFVVGGPVGAAIGGAVGFVKGVFSSSSKRKERRRDEAEQAKAARLQAQRAELIREITVREQERLTGESQRIISERDDAIQLVQQARQEGDQQAELEANEIVQNLQDELADLRQFSEERAQEQIAILDTERELEESLLTGDQDRREAALQNAPENDPGQYDQHDG